MKDRKLTNKQAAFVREYIIDYNATQAAIRAGYSAKTAYSQGQRLLKKVEIKAALSIKNKEADERCLVTVEYIIEGFREVIERSLQRKPVEKWNYEEKRLEQVTEEVAQTDGTTKEEGVWQYDSHGANKALEMLGRYKQMFKDGAGQPVSVTVNMTDYSKAPEAQPEKPAQRFSPLDMEKEKVLV